MADQIKALKDSIAALWQMENQLRYSAWCALAMEKKQAQEHLAKAREQLNVLLNREDPADFVPDQPPNTDPDKPAQ